MEILNFAIETIYSENAVAMADAANSIETAVLVVREIYIPAVMAKDQTTKRGLNAELENANQNLAKKPAIVAEENAARAINDVS